MEIIELTAQHAAAWDHYVCSAPHGLPQHLSGWRTVMNKVYGYQTCYLLAQEVAEIPKIVGVLPLFFVRSLITGNRAMTMPGGLCAENEQIALALLEQGRASAEKAGAKRLFLQDSRQCWADEIDRGQSPCHPVTLSPPHLVTTQNHVAWRVDLRGTLEEIEKRLDRNIRRQIRMAQRNELTVEISSDANLITPFYQVWSRFTHEMGTPVFGRNFLQAIVETFPNQYNIVIVYKQNQPIGGYFQLQMGDTIYGVWGATLHEFLELRPVYLAYWEMMAYGQRNGYHYLDMGRSPLDSNASAFKAQWGGVSQPIYQQVIDFSNKLQQDQPPAQQLPGGLKTDMFTQIWRRLPFSITQICGPMLRRHIPFA